MTQTYSIAHTRRTSAVEPAKFAEFIAAAIGSPLPTWTNLIGNANEALSEIFRQKTEDCPPDGPQEPPPDWSMRCYAVRLLNGPMQIQPDGKIEVELLYREVTDGNR